MSPCHLPAAIQTAAAPSRPSAVLGDVREQISRLQHDGGTYRAIAAAAGLAHGTVHDLATGRRPPTPATTRALSTVTSDRLHRARLDAGAPGCGCAPCTSWGTARPASPAPSASAR